MKVWIDMSNSPHPLLFAPVARRLRELGHEVAVTARANAQTLELTLQTWPDARVVGGESPEARLEKGRALARRVGGLVRWARRERPDVALSHNSYAQIVAARLLRIRSVTAMDFEHQPANHLAFRLAESILVPEVMPVDVLRRQGAHGAKVRRYPGFKEELYLGDFVPDERVLSGLGIEARQSALVVIRTPPSRAVYHRFGNPLFVEALKVVGPQAGVRGVVLCRHSEQRQAIADLALHNCIVPERAVDSRSLMYAADLVIGAGGTMTREAALMGVPTLSAYAGAPLAVDSALEAQGRLRRLVRADQVADIRRRDHGPEPLDRLRRRSEQITEIFVQAPLARR